MNRNKFLKYSLFSLVFSVIIAVFLGVPINTCIHELGHYSAAYIFDKSQINDSKCFIPENFFSTEAFGDFVVAGQVTYNKPVFDAFPFYQAVVTTLAGPILQLAFFIILLLVLDSMLKHKSNNNWNYILRISFVLGLIFGSSQLTVGWIRDVNLILVQYTTNFSILAIIILGIYYLAMLSYYFIVISFVFRFWFILAPSIEKKFKSNRTFMKIFGRTT